MIWAEKDHRHIDCEQCGTGSITMFRCQTKQWISAGCVCMARPFFSTNPSEEGVTEKDPASQGNSYTTAQALKFGIHN